MAGIIGPMNGTRALIALGAVAVGAATGAFVANERDTNIGRGALAGAGIAAAGAALVFGGLHLLDHYSVGKRAAQQGASALQAWSHAPSTLPTAAELFQSGAHAAPVANASAAATKVDLASSISVASLFDDVASGVGTRAAATIAATPQLPAPTLQAGAATTVADVFRRAIDATGTTFTSALNRFR